MRGMCRETKLISTSLAVSSSLSDIPDGHRCPIADLIEHKREVELIFREYQGVKRLGLRTDPSIPTDYLVALDLELQAIDVKDRDHKQKERKAREMRARRR